MQLGAARLRQGRVGSVPDQDVPEAQPADRRRLQQVAPHQAPAGRLQVGPREAAGEGEHGGDPERLALHGAALEQLTLDGVEPVEARHEQRLQRGRQALGAPVLPHERRELLQEQRVAAGRGRHAAPVVGGEGAAGDTAQQRFALLGAQRA